MTVGERIKARRIELSMSQAELAELVGYKEKATISKIEANERTLRQSKIILFANALNVSPLWLLTGEDVASEQEEERFEEYLDLLKQLTPEDQKHLLEYMKFLLKK